MCRQYIEFVGKITGSKNELGHERIWPVLRDLTNGAADQTVDLQ